MILKWPGGSPCFGLQFLPLVLGCSPNETSWVEVTNEPVPKFWRREELRSWLKGSGTSTCDLLLGLPSSQAQWVDRLAEATGWLEVELTA
jgi:hypothetical protein